MLEYDAKAPEVKPAAYKNLFKLSQLILDAKSDYFYRYTDGPNKDLRVSVKDEVTRIIGRQPKDGQDYYQQFYGPEADTLLKDAKDAGYEKPRLAEVAQRYFFTKAGTEAALLLAAVNLEAGNYPEAAYVYRRLLARPDADKVLDHRRCSARRWPSAAPGTGSRPTRWPGCGGGWRRTSRGRGWPSAARRMTLPP